MNGPTMEAIPRHTPKKQKIMLEACGLAPTASRAATPQVLRAYRKRRDDVRAGEEKDGEGEDQRDVEDVEKEGDDVERSDGRTRGPERRRRTRARTPKRCRARTRSPTP